ncbi:MAG: non-ribosomal peptide synthetase [Steroidobacteraceae bacterium]
MKYETLVDILENNRNVERAVTYVLGENEERRLPYREVHARALGILYHLQAMGAQRGQPMIIFLANNEQFMDGFWAAVCGGMIPVPLAVGISDEHRHKLLRIAAKLTDPILYTDRKSLDRLGSLAQESGQQALFDRLKARTFLADAITDISKPGKLHRPSPQDTAFIQFSSGSTSEPKGVVLTHANLVTNIKASIQRCGFNQDDVTLSWMPLTHDMGLIGFYIMHFTAQAHVHIMPTELFVRRPLLWLQTCSKKRVTITCSPNFGYRHLLKVLGDRKPDGLDLSSLRLIFNGAEPISVELCNEFMDKFAGCGLKRTAMYPVYGLAEASLAVAFPPAGSNYRWIRVNRHKLNVGDVVELNPAQARDSLELMSVGSPIPFVEVRIADDARAALPEGRVGHILIRGANVTGAYYGDEAATRQAIDAEGWLDTGDLGVVREGQLYITGRSKEIIFVNGQNYFPYDLENIAQRAPGLELGKVVVAGVRRPQGQSDELTIFVLHRSDMAEFLPTANAVAHLVNEHAGLEVAQVVPVKRIPKTTSGKVQRHLMEESFLNGEFDADLAELERLRAAGHGASAPSASAIEQKILAICDAALPGKGLAAGDNLFEIGASSLKLIEIHENIDREFPNQIDLTELFDHPTVQQLAKHLEGKLGK